jgi:hypothetical protein
MQKTKLIMLLALISFISIAGTAFFTNRSSTTPVVAAEPGLPVVTVYKNATCGCCKDWVRHMQDNGFRVEAHDVGNLLPYKEQAKLGAGMGSCHTAFVGGYAIEGHVPAWDVKRLLTEKPDISGLTVPRMPAGSPGMEVPGQPADAYQVISYKDGEETGVFSDYPSGK